MAPDNQPRNSAQRAICAWCHARAAAACGCTARIVAVSPAMMTQPSARPRQRRCTTASTREMSVRTALCDFGRLPEFEVSVPHRAPHTAHHNRRPWPRARSQRVQNAGGMEHCRCTPSACHTKDRLRAVACVSPAGHVRGVCQRCARASPGAVQPASAVHDACVNVDGVGESGDAAGV